MIFNSQHILADSTLIKDEKCQEMIKQYVTNPFYLDLSFKNKYNLESPQYFELVKSTVTESMTDLCSTKKNLVGLSEFKDSLNMSCINSCEKYKNTYSSNAKAQTHARAACQDVCKNSNKKIQFIERGIAMASVRETKDVASCGKNITTTSRSSVKEIETGGSVQKNSKKTSGK